MIPRRELATIRRRLAATAPAPWVVERDAAGAPRIRTDADADGRELVIWRDFEPAPEADVEFIALARNLLDRLVDAADDAAVDLVSPEELDSLERAAQQAWPRPPRHTGCGSRPAARVSPSGRPRTESSRRRSL